jgi:hypothetical protein
MISRLILISSWFTNAVFMGTRVTVFILLGLNLAKVTPLLSYRPCPPQLVFCCLVPFTAASFFYLLEFSLSYFGAEYVQYTWIYKKTGKYWWVFWAMVLTNLILPQLLLFKRHRASPRYTFFILLPHLLAFTFIMIIEGQSYSPDLNTGFKLIIYTLSLLIVYLLNSKRN